MHVASDNVNITLQQGIKIKLFEPADGYENLAASFCPWKLHPKYSAMCQGHWNAQNQLDGLAVRITPYKQIQIAYYKKDRRHGQCHTIFVDGTTWTANYKDNQLYGSIVKTKPEGTRTVKTFLKLDSVVANLKVKKGERQF